MFWLLHVSVWSDIHRTPGCGNTEILCLSLGKLSEKKTCLDKILLVLFLFKHSILANTVAGSWVSRWTFLKSIASWSVTEESVHNWNKSNLVYGLFVWLCKTLDIILIKLMQVPRNKWSLPKWRPFICVVSEWQDVLRYNISCVEKILISIKFILIKFGNGFVHQKLNQSCV